ncbi:toll-like receptor 5 [Patella vulgata]|uniref:toll-like receptor 5 n=1 Tax=Patella vulgata TaxID=6465 RepID=UPI0024A93DBC|nr:toll-like receptor 5 [Patella vulgata]
MCDVSKFLTFPIPTLTKCLRHLDVSNNMILGKVTNLIDFYLLFPRFENLEYLDLSKQLKFSLDGNTEFDKPHPPSRPGSIPVYLPPKLKYLYLNGLAARLGTTPNVHFIGGSNLVHLNFSYSMLTLYNEAIISGLENLHVLDLSQDNCRYINQSFFDTFPNLTTLRLSRVNFDTDQIFNIGKRLFQPLKKLQNLDLTNNLLTGLPHDIFDDLIELQVVSLSYNNLISVPDLTHLVNLESIFLSFNALVTVDGQTRNTLDALSKGNRVHVSFYGNTFACICENSDMLDWFIQTRVDLDGRNYSCVDWKGERIYTNHVYRHYRDFQQHCISGTWFTISITGSSVILLALLTCFIFVKNKLKVKLFLLRMIGRYIQPKTREEFAYDVCVLYADDVYQWVCHNMYQELEVRRGLKLYLRHKDEPIGGDKPQELYNSMDSSWKVVLILTPGLLADVFSAYTMSVCLSFITLTTPNRLMLIIDKGMDIPTNIDYFLEAVNEENVYRYEINHLYDDDPQLWNNIYNGITARNL